jgi:hypothetical protein
VRQYTLEELNGLVEGVTNTICEREDCEVPGCLANKKTAAAIKQGGTFVLGSEAKKLQIERDTLKISVDDLQELNDWQTRQITRMQSEQETLRSQNTVLIDKNAALNKNITETTELVNRNSRQAHTISEQNSTLQNYAKTVSRLHDEIDALHRYPMHRATNTVEDGQFRVRIADLEQRNIKLSQELSDANKMVRDFVGGSRLTVALRDIRDKAARNISTVMISKPNGENDYKAEWRIAHDVLTYITAEATRILQ